MRKKKVVIIGGGNAGIAVAAQLKNKTNAVEIVIVDPSEHHYYQPAWTLVGAGTYDVDKTVRPQQSVIPKGVQWMQQAVTSILPDENRITLNDQDNLTYDYLVVTPGIQLDWGKVVGLKESLGKNGVCSNYKYGGASYTWQCIQNTKNGNAVFTNPNTPVKCGGAPQKIMYLAADYFQKQNNTGVKTHFYSAGGVIFGVAKYAAVLNKVISRYQIQTHFKHNLVEVKGEAKIAVFETINKAGQSERVEVPFDMLHVTPPQSAPDFIKNSPLAAPDNPLGWVDVHKHTTQHNRYKNVFSIGDSSSLPNAKTGAAIRKQAPVLVANLLASMAGKPLTAKYNGYGSCPLVTGYGKLMLAEFDYNNQPQESFVFNQGKERWSMWLLKKYLLPWLYWNRILKGKA